MRKSATMALAMMTSMVALSTASLAQDPSEDSVLTRQRPDFDPLGIRAGTFLIFPEIKASTTYDNNIFATDGDEEDDIIFGIQPKISARSQWARNALNVTADADVGFYLDNDESNFQDYGLAVDGRVNVIGESTIRYAAYIRQEHEDRDSPDDVGDEDVTDLIDGAFAVNYRHFINRIFIQPGITARRFDFSDSGPINNDDRDRWKYTPALRVGYTISPALSLFVNGEFNQVVYDESPDDFGVDRDSIGYAATVGTEFDLTGKLFGEVQIGFQAQEYDDDRLDDFSGLRAGGQITYNVTPLTALVLNAGGGIEETTVNDGFEEASANRQLTAGLQVIHELQRNLILSANGSYIRDDFEGIDRTDDRFGAGVGLSYSISRNISVDLNYNYSTRSSDIDGEEFDRNVVTIGLTGRL